MIPYFLHFFLLLFMLYKYIHYLLLLLFICKVISDSFVISWTVAHQATLSMGFPRHEYWSVLLFPSLVALLDSGIEPAAPALAGRHFTLESPGKPIHYLICNFSCGSGVIH